MNREAIIERMQKRILVLDGAMGTQIQKLKLGANNMDMLNLTDPEAIKRIHKSYIEAGAEIIETNTFSSTAISQKEYGAIDKVYELNRAGAAIALEAARESSNTERVIVAGCIGPTIRSLTLSPDVNRPEFRNVSFDEMAEAFKSQALGLIDGGADVLLVESVYDGLNLKAALYAISKVLEDKGLDVPIMVSVTINDAFGRILTGQTLASIYTEIANYNVLSFGLNCSFGAKDLMPCIKEINGFATDCAISVYPNAGLPDEMGCYKETPEYTAACIKEMAEQGLLNIAGGCCGTTPEHIKAIAEAVRGCKPRSYNVGQIESRKIDDVNDLYVSGLENTLINRAKRNFTNVGERTNVAGSAKFAKLLRERNFAEAASIAAKQIEDGATVIDINTDDPMADGNELMESFLRYLGSEPEVAKAPFMIDSSNFETLLTGVKNSTGKPIVNSISLKEGEAEFISRARELYKLGAAVIVMAFDEKGQAAVYERKVEICQRAYNLLISIGFRPSDIIFDCNILTIATGIFEHNNYAADFIKAVKWIKANLKGAKTSGGVSNLSFAFRGNNAIRRAMHSVFLYHAINAGLDMAIVNPSMIDLYEDIEPTLREAIEGVIFNRSENATEILIEAAAKLKEKESAAPEQKVVSGSLAERLQHSIIKGDTSTLESDVMEALKVYKSPVEILEGPLMEGLESVGNLFEQGKMFLPQVVKSARVMKSAVTILQPFIEKYNKTLQEGGGQVKEKPVVVLATAKGDIHDIGKNIISIVLSCNNFEVVDLGVMVDNELIVNEAIKRKASLIGVSGLITPSLKYIEELAALLESNKERMLMELGYLIPLAVGGATTSSVHTAVKIAPLYSGAVIHGGDASKASVAYKKLIANPLGGYLELLKRSQAEVRREYSHRKIQTVSLEEARANAPKYLKESYLASKGYGSKGVFVKELPLAEIADKIDWTPLFIFWGFKGKFPTVAPSSDAAKELYNAANKALRQIVENNEVEAGAVLEFFDAASEDEKIEILSPSGFKAEFGFPRQTDKNSEYLSVADFVVPKAMARKQPDDYAKVGVFAVKIEDKRSDEFNHKSFEYLLRYSLCARLTEALVNWMQAEALKTVASEEKPHILRPAFGYAVCPDHTLKRVAFNLLGAEEKIGLHLTDSNAMIPTTAVCGLLIAHPNAKFFDV